MPTSKTTPEVIGDYQLEEPVARGGMGEIWRATARRTGEPVAIKRLLVDTLPGRSEELQDRLLREIQAFSHLSHDNIVRCLDSGLDAEGRPYLALEWLEGEDLAARQRQAPLELHQIVEVARQTLDGLAACHDQGVIHRDIKPANLFLVQSEGGFRVKVLDFGLAILDDEASRLTQAGKIMGTLFYLSPEQARGDRDVDLRADIYAMGVVLYELVTGKLPFRSDGAATVLLKIITERPPRPRQLRPALPRWLEAVILRAMQREPGDRYPSARRMLEELQAGLASGDLQASTHAHAASADVAVEPTLLDAELSSMENRLVSLLCVQPGTGSPDPTQIGRAIEEAGGRVFRLLGGQIIGLFGLDKTAGDEAVRAVRAGLAIRDAAEPSAGPDAAVRMLAGTVHLEVGQGLHLDTKELDRATRRLSSFPAGELVVDLPTREQLGDLITTERVGQQDVVRALGVESPIRRKVLDVETPTVGRETELAAIRAAFSRAVENEEPEAVLILGPPGIGKSRLSQELAPQVRDRCALFLEARAFSHGTRGIHYSLLAQGLARAAGVHVVQDHQARREALISFVGHFLSKAEVDDAAAFIGEAIGVPLAGEITAVRVARAEPKVMREQITAAFEALLGEAGRQGPIGICLEDLHWADEESLQLLDQLLERLERTPLFVIATSRPELDEQHPGLFSAIDGTRVELRPLGRRPLRKLLRSVLGKDLSPDLEQMIAQWSDGNPYFVEELVSWMVARRALVRESAGWQLRGSPSTLRLPAGIEAAVQGRLDHLAPELKELLKAAAIQGEVFWEGACEAHGFADAADQLRQLEADQFVVRRRDCRIAGTREWAFRHALLHQVASQMLPLERRRPLHLQLARWLEEKEEPDAALLAHHFEEGGDQQRAAHHYAGAGTRALADGDLNRAVDCYLCSISGPKESLTPNQQAERVMGLARAYILLGRYDQAWMAMDHIVPSAESQIQEAKQAEILFLRGRILLGKGQYEQAERTLEQAVEALLLQQNADLAFEAQHTLFWVIWVQGRYKDAGQIAEQLYQEALTSARSEQLCSAKLAFAYYHVVEGDLSMSVNLASEAVSHAREIGHPYREVDSLNMLGSAQEMVGLYDEAMDSLGTAHALADRLKTTFHQASISAGLGRVCRTRGQITEALAHYRTAADKAESLGDYRTLIDALTGQARALIQEVPEQDLEQAQKSAERALEIAIDHAPPTEAAAHLALSEVNLTLGNAEEACARALAAVEVLDRLGTQERYEIEILLAAHRALQAVGKSEKAREQIERAWTSLRRRARRITDEAIRSSFLEKVSYNRQVRSLREAAS